MKLQFFKRKECVCLTWLSKTIILFMAIVVLFLIIVQLPQYLSKNAPLKKGILVIDGNLPDYALEEAIQIFHKNQYRQIVATGGNFHSGHYVSGKKSMPELTRATLIELGLDSMKITVIECGTVFRNRTQKSAKELSQWISKNDIPITHVDVLTTGCHAQRSQLLFQRALGRQYSVGVWAIPDRTYDIDNWWNTSKGARTVISEIIAYFYTLLFLSD